MVNVICVVCGKEFQAQKTTKKYCSKDCENAMRRKKWAERPKEEKEQKLMPVKKCMICEQEFRPSVDE